VNIDCGNKFPQICDGFGCSSERRRSSNREKITAYRDYLNSQQDAA